MSTYEEEKTFDPQEYIRGIQQLLVSDKKKIAFLFGAGTSMAQKEESSHSVPGIGKMTKMVVEDLENDDKKGDDYKTAIEEIKEEFKIQSIDFNIENLLSNIETKTTIVGNGKLNHMDKAGFQDMNEKIRDQIKEIVSVHKNLAPNQEKTLVQHDFAKWIRNADRKHGIEIFTTNYDYLLEIGLESVKVPYYDGFTGGYQPFFNPDSVEDMNYLPQQTKLWKIHGSLGLHEEMVGDLERVVRVNSDKECLLIYPSFLKYSNSKKQPYASYIDRLNSFLKQDDAVLFICGYSFGDDHINERIVSALNTSTTAHVYIFYYDIVRSETEDNKYEKEYSFTPDCKLAQIASENRKISVFASRNAIIGGQYGEWKLKGEPDNNDSLNISWYFDEDAPFNEGAVIGNEYKGELPWTGKGELILPNFRKITAFMKHMIPKNKWEVEDNE